jgi:hypothetical protein
MVRVLHTHYFSVAQFGVKQLYTYSNILDHNLEQAITNAMQNLEDSIRARNFPVDSNINLVLDAWYDDEKNVRCQYYLVNHQTRCVFWMEQTGSELFPVTYELSGITSESHMHIRVFTSLFSWRELRRYRTRTHGTILVRIQSDCGVCRPLTLSGNTVTSFRVRGLLLPIK